MIVSVLTAFVFCTALTPLIILVCRKKKWFDPVDPRKVHSGLVPRLGGLGIISSFLVAAVVYGVAFSSADYRYAVPVFVGGAVIFLAGVIDDFADLHARLKFLIQIAAAAVVVAGGFYFRRFLMFDLPPFIGMPLTLLWILFLVNAYNLIDGLDLLCGGLSFLTVLTLGVLMLCNVQDMGALYVILCGAIFGFLLFNRPPARIFLGDGGSQTMGFVIAVAPLFKTATPTFEDIKLPVMLLLVSIPFTDVIAAVWRRKRDHRSFFSADRAHIHHKLVNIGFSKPATSFCLLSLQLIICLVAFSTTLMSGRRAALILLSVSLCFVWFIFIVLHYTNRSVNLHHKGQLADAPQEEH